MNLKYILTGALLIGISSASISQKLPGTADSTFNGNGYGLFNFGDKTAQGISGLIGPDGKLIAAGGSLSATLKWNVGISRINLDGSDDMTFRSNSGPSNIDFNNGAGDHINTIIKHPDGGYLAVGGIAGANGLDVLVIRFTDQGNVDLNFGSGGIFTHQVDPGYEAASHILVDSKGRIVIFGDVPNTLKQMFIMRLYPYGGLDVSFSGDGILFVDPLNASNSPVALLERPLGGYYMVCNTHGNSESKVTVQSISENGNLNIDLGGAGEVSLKLETFNTTATEAIFHNGSIFICGNYDGPQGNQDGFLARLETDGTWNSSFAGTGYARILHNLSNPHEEEVRGMEIAPDSSIFIVTLCHTPDTLTLIQSRFKSDGNVEGFYGNKNGSHHNYSLYDSISEFSIDNIVLDTGAKRLYIMGQQNTPSQDGFFVYATYTGNFAQAQSGGGTGLSSPTQNLTVYPNPASNWLHLDLDDSKGIIVKIFDLQGREVMEANSTQIDIKTLNKGMYVVQASQFDRLYTAKIQVID